MNLDLAFEIWTELKSYLTPSDRNDAADSIVELLVNNDYKADEILESFRTDKEVKRSLNAYLKDHEEVQDDEEDDIDDFLDDFDDDDEDY